MAMARSTLPRRVLCSVSPSNTTTPFTANETTVIFIPSRKQLSPEKLLEFVSRITIFRLMAKPSGSPRRPHFRVRGVDEIYPVDVDVFVAERAGDRPPVLCLEGQPNGSGEADRYEQIFLLIDPLGHHPAFLHLPSLLSSCRAIRVTAGGQIAFPKNSYLLNEAQDTRIGLRVSYFTFERGQFVPTNQETRLRFVSPENPFEFAPQD
jgi:hypothetical protein